MKNNSQSIKKFGSTKFNPIKWAVFTFISIFILGIYTKSVHASLISFFSEVLKSHSASAESIYNVPTSNLQTIALLQGATHFDPNPEKHLESVPISSERVLVREMVVSDPYLIDTPRNTAISTYVVRSGDTISGIADMFGVSINTVLWANDLTSRSILKEGQTLVILPISGITHTISKGDTLSTIVNKYKSDMNDILAYNDLTENSSLIPGKTIIIPYAELRISVPITKTTQNGNQDFSTPSYAGYYARPIAGGMRTQGVHGYNGVDIAAPIGTPIYAAAPGTVIVSKSGAWNGGYGNFVIISHDNGTQTLYAHNTKNLVVVGQRVERGEQIATVGSTGKSTGAHLHFEVRGAKNPF